MISWEPAPETALLELKNGKWVTIYTGADSSSTVSGKPNGIYHYRLDNSETSSAVLTVKVAHHNPGKALGFFITGAVVFMLTLLLVIKGHKRD